MCSDMTGMFINFALDLNFIRSSILFEQHESNLILCSVHTDQSTPPSYWPRTAQIY